MIAKHLSVVWTAFASPLGNHLWQSTVFAAAAGLLTLILWRNQAWIRFWLWFAALVKFLIPFSLLVDIGSHLAWSRCPAGTSAGLYFAMEEFAQPFKAPTAPVMMSHAISATSPRLSYLLPTLCVAMWFLGFVVVLSVWFARWWRIAA
jgi:hypothetical protein